MFSFEFTDDMDEMKYFINGTATLSSDLTKSDVDEGLIIATEFGKYKNISTHTQMPTE